MRFNERDSQYQGNAVKAAGFGLERGMSRVAGENIGVLGSAHPRLTDLDTGDSRLRCRPPALLLAALITR